MKNQEKHILFLIQQYLKHLRLKKSASGLTLKAYTTDLMQFFFHQQIQSSHISVISLFEELCQIEKSSRTNRDLFLLNDSISRKTKPLSKKEKEHKMAEKKQKAKNTKLIKEKIKENSDYWSLCSPATRNRKTASLKSFLKWLYTNQYLNEDVNRKLHSPKIPVKIPHFLSIDEITSLIDTVSKSDSSKKDLALILLLYGGGLRISEACSARWNHFDFSQKTLRIKGKGGKERLIVLPTRTAHCIHSLKKESPFIFSSLYPRKAYCIVRNWGIKAGIKKPISPHVLRHSYATHLLDSGSDLRVIQDLLGHSCLSATQKYTQVHLSKLARVLEESHPLSHRKSV